MKPLPHPFSLFFWTVCLATTGLCAQNAQLAFGRSDTVLRLEFSTESGKVYDLESSLDLNHWDPPVWSHAGDGQVASYEVSLADAVLRFYRLAVRGPDAGLAPEPSVITDALAGVTWQGYNFQDATRFDWQGEPGNWTYEKTGPNTGLLVFTYDEDGNNAAAYREEVILEFETPTTGTYRYSEYLHGIEDPGSVSGSAFVFTFLQETAPSPEAMAARLVAKTWEGYVFLSEDRFDWESPGHTGNWLYEKTGRQTGLLVFTYDKDGNDPEVYREQMTLTFSQEDRGTALYSEYLNGVKRSARDHLFSFRLP